MNFVIIEEKCENVSDVKQWREQPTKQADK